MKALAWATALMFCASDLLAQNNFGLLSVDTAASHIYVVTHRTGLLSFLGHEHVISAPRWTAALCLDDRDIAGSYARFTIDARALVIDDDAARRRARLGRGPSPKQRAELQRKMLHRLSVDSFPELRFESVAIQRGGAEQLRVSGRLTLRGSTQMVEFPVLVKQRGDNRSQITAELEVKQSAFGIRPESIAGVVKVADPIDFHVLLVTQPKSASSCNH